METTGSELLEQLLELSDCAENLRTVLLKFKRADILLAALIESGIPTLEALERSSTARLRPEMTVALDEFTTARHRARLALLAQAVGEGASMAEAGRAFSVSRQLVSRMIAEHQRQAEQPRS